MSKRSTKKESAPMTDVVQTKPLHHLKSGDRVTRMLAGKLAMLMEVTGVDAGVITCAAVEPDGTLIHAGWTFSAANGGEIDEDLGWNPPTTPTGSFIVDDIAKATHNE